MIVKEITTLLEELAPLDLAEDFDNVGLLVGNENSKVTGILVTLDTLENVVDEAIAKKCNLIVSFHPIIFSGLKKIIGATYIERVVIKAIQHKISIYSMHTALDNSPKGVSAKICQILDLQHPKILIPKTGAIKKLTTYVPTEAIEKLKEALFAVGAGHIGNYSHCSFGTEGMGSYRPGKDTNPMKGKKGSTHHEAETQLGLIYYKRDEGKILRALFTNHPYEEVAYELFTLENPDQKNGMGMIGQLRKPTPMKDFLNQVKTKMKAKGIRHSQLLDKKVVNVAVLGGSGSFAITAAKAAGADVFITSDIKYHQFYEAEGKMLIADIGHYETEQYTKNLLVEFLKEKIPNFAIHLSESKTNPINYL